MWPVFPSGDPRIEQVDQAWWLVTGRITTSIVPDAYDEANAMVARMLGFVRAVDPRQGVVRLAGPYIDPTGQRGTIVSVGTAGSDARVFAPTIIGGAGPPRPPPGPPIVVLAESDDAVRDILDLIGPHPLDFFTLFKVYEIVRDEVSRGGIITQGWATDEELRTFTESSNRHEISGRAARHARLSGQPSGRAMSLGQAQTLVLRIANRFLFHRAEEAGVWFA